MVWHNNGLLLARSAPSAPRTLCSVSSKALVERRGCPDRNAASPMDVAGKLSGRSERAYPASARLAWKGSWLDLSILRRSKTGGLHISNPWDHSGLEMEQRRLSSQHQGDGPVGRISRTGKALLKAVVETAGRNLWPLSLPDRGGDGEGRLRRTR